MADNNCRLAVDVGGTFTDVALEYGEFQVTSKVLTTPGSPELGVLEGIKRALDQSDLVPANIDILIHGTTLATNALIERKGAKVALITTEGLRDSVEMAQENRFDQYDINIDRPTPLVPRYLRWSVRERLNVKGEALIPVSDETVHALIPNIDKYEIDSVAIGLIHSYANPAHEQRVAEILSKARPGLSLTLSSEVCPEIREYERQSTASANAYVQPMMSRYLKELDRQLIILGFNCPFLLMTSGGGLTTLDTAIKFPVRLVESGPAGGAILATEIARDCGIKDVLSFDMGGTTAKICLIDNHIPQMTRTFEVARVYRNLKGSGLPVRIPAIEMVEIGAGGGSIAKVDNMSRITVGPESAGAMPGPACYGQNGSDATVTDADVVLGRINPEGFAGGAVDLQPEMAGRALEKAVGEKLALDATLSAFGVSEIVDENMANAARVHAIEWGKDISARSMIAFGGAAPLHASRLAEKLNIDEVIIPSGAGVGSAIGFLRAPISYEVVRSRFVSLSDFDPEIVNALLDEMSNEASEIVSLGAGSKDLVEQRLAYMRYHGQGHEIVVSVPVRKLNKSDAETLRQSFELEYSRLYGRSVPGQQPEVLSWTISVTAPKPITKVAHVKGNGITDIVSVGKRKLFDPGTSEFLEATVYNRHDLSQDSSVDGPAVIIESQTTTIVSKGYSVSANNYGHLVIKRQFSEEASK
ncbi:MAG: hydantoinase/oxoprolinase family protein [Alphaproteobacteria bacterium]|nr:hydantoinase/oxoprolinase family protein [Alphaproteobacteria bacterium]